jgi:hypothetical protein
MESDSLPEHPPQSTTEIAHLFQQFQTIALDDVSQIMTVLHQLAFWQWSGTDEDNELALKWIKQIYLVSKPAEP